jgi:hypothetical protein
VCHVIDFLEVRILFMHIEIIVGVFSQKRFRRIPLYYCRSCGWRIARGYNSQ